MDNIANAIFVGSSNIECRKNVERIDFLIVTIFMLNMETMEL